ncbi:MAG TPA: ribosome-binding factor A [Deltaproteobacteria bacterium]|nr:ribosome-binding factor A [Deltaproteobacteria bacterium]HQB38304.1 ribosome-binding factor A [Deltaproteobacteria bacterium]
MSKRSEKVAETIHETISAMLSRGLNDPRIGFVTITAVDVIEDLSQARIHFTVIGDETARRNSEAGLNSARGYFRKELGRVLTIRHIPEISFRYDHSQEYGNRIDSILKEIGAGDAGDNSQDSK